MAKVKCNKCGFRFAVPSCRVRDPSKCPKCGFVARHRYLPLG